MRQKLVGSFGEFVKPYKQANINKIESINLKTKHDSIDFYVKEMDKLISGNLFFLNDEELREHHRHNHKAALTIFKSQAVLKRDKSVFNKWRNELSNYIHGCFSCYKHFNKVQISYKQQIQKISKGHQYLSKLDFIENDEHIRERLLRWVYRTICMISLNS